MNDDHITPDRVVSTLPTTVRPLDEYSTGAGEACFVRRGTNKADIDEEPHTLRRRSRHSSRISPSPAFGGEQRKDASNPHAGAANC